MSDMGEMVVRVRIRPLRTDDIPGVAWAGGRTHLRAMEAELSKDTDYLGAFLRNGQSVGKAGISYEAVPAAGVIWQVAVHPLLQSCGIGARLMLGAEEKIRQRGLTLAELGVETNNPRARELYERLGYRAVRTEESAWDQERPDGMVYRYETVLTVMSKDLGVGD